ncbi:MAG: hypothetical protein KC708_07565 [Anaerolineae bacterium]|nr:hypothetical protein [Anaerolineae bacterium]
MADKPKRKHGETAKAAMWPLKIAAGMFILTILVKIFADISLQGTLVAPLYATQIGIALRWLIIVLSLVGPPLLVFVFILMLLIGRRLRFDLIGAIVLLILSFVLSSVLIFQGEIYLIDVIELDNHTYVLSQHRDDYDLRYYPVTLHECDNWFFLCTAISHGNGAYAYAPYRVDIDNETKRITVSLPPHLGSEPRFVFEYQVDPSE